MTVTLKQAVTPYALGVGAAFVGSCGIAYKYSSLYVRIRAMGAAFAAVGAAFGLVFAFATTENTKNSDKERVDAFQGRVIKYMLNGALTCAGPFIVVAIMLTAMGAFREKYVPPSIRVAQSAI